MTIDKRGNNGPLSLNDQSVVKPDSTWEALSEVTVIIYN